jgi:hypothetical protein
MILQKKGYKVKGKIAVLAVPADGKPVGLKQGRVNSKDHWQTKVSFAVGVTDNGESGTNDFFSIQLSNGCLGEPLSVKRRYLHSLQHIGRG